MNIIVSRTSGEDWMQKIPAGLLPQWREHTFKADGAFQMDRQSEVFKVQMIQKLLWKCSKWVLKVSLQEWVLKTQWPLPLENAQDHKKLGKHFWAPAGVSSSQRRVAWPVGNVETGVPETLLFGPFLCLKAPLGTFYLTNLVSFYLVYHWYLLELHEPRPFSRLLSGIPHQ